MIFGDVLSPYSHRRNDNGTTDAICLYCFRTVGTSACATELQRAEWQHACAPAPAEPAVRDLALLSANLQYLQSTGFTKRPLWQERRHLDDDRSGTLFHLLDTITFQRRDPSC